MPRGIDLHASVVEQAPPGLPDSLKAYLKGFVNTCLPHETLVSASFIGDVTGDAPSLFEVALLLSRQGSDGQKRDHTLQATLLLEDSVRVIRCGPAEETP